MNTANTHLPRRRFLVWAVAILFVAGAVGFYFWSAHRSADTVYREIVVERGDIALTVLATGTVLPENRLEIKPPIAGRVEQVLVKEGQTVAKGQLLAWMSSTERAALLDAARSSGSDELKRWEELYRATPVMAPIGGTIILRNVEAGQTFTNTDSILVMADRLTVKAQVDETDVAKVKLQQPAEIVLDAYADEKIPAIVAQIAFEAKTVNNITTYEVEVLPKAVPPFMRSGMTANVTFLVEDRRAVLWVPTEAVKTQGQSAGVLMRDAQSNKPVVRPIQTGLSDGKRTEVIAGLNAGDTILVGKMPGREGRSRGSGSPLNPSRRPASR